jgi:hypothetical protein
MQGGGKQAEEKGIEGLVVAWGEAGERREGTLLMQGDGDTNLRHPLPTMLQENRLRFESGKRGGLHTILLMGCIVATETGCDLESRDFDQTEVTDGAATPAGRSGEPEEGVTFCQTAHRRRQVNCDR